MGDSFIMRDLTIITLSRSLDYFHRMLEALDSQVGDVPEYMGVLVNNASDLNITSTALHSAWAVIDQGYNTTYSEGNNLGVDLVQKASPSEWLLFLNDDAVPEPTWLAELWARRRSADVIGCLLLHEDGTVNHAGTKVSTRCQSDHIGRGGDRGDYSDFVYTPAVTFAAALVNTRMFQHVGGFDPRYNYGFEDMDLCLKVIEAGGRVGCARQAVAVHGECGTRPRGGQADQHNAAQFIQSWKHRIRGVLASYVEHNIHPETVEGIWV